MDVKKTLILLAWFLGPLALARPSKTPPLLESSTPTVEEVRTALTTALKEQGDTIKKFVRRMPGKTLEMQSFISMEGNVKLASQILPDFKKLPEWALDKINESPSGKNYFFKIMGADWEAGNVLGFRFLMDLPLFKQEGVRKFKFTYEKIAGGMLVVGEAVANPDSIIASTVAKMYVFPGTDAPERLWLGVLSKVVIRSWLLYEALPEKLINNESTERLATIVGNYQKAEDKLKLALRKANHKTEND